MTQETALAEIRRRLTGIVGAQEALEELFRDDVRVTATGHSLLGLHVFVESHDVVTLVKALVGETFRGFAVVYEVMSAAELDRVEKALRPTTPA